MLFHHIASTVVHVIPVQHAHYQSMSEGYLFVLTLLSHVGMKPCINSGIFDTNVSNSLFERVDNLNVCINAK